MPYKGLPRKCKCGASPPPWKFVRRCRSGVVVLMCGHCFLEKVSRGRAARRLAAKAVKEKPDA